MIRDAVILCGGLGTRLRSEIPDLPKAMAPVQGRPFLEYQLDYLLQEGIQHFILATGYLAEHLERHFGPCYRGIPITYSREAQPLGTGGAARQAAQHVQAFPFLMLNGDTYCPTPLPPLLASHTLRKALVSMVLSHQADSARYGRVDLDPEGRVLAFREKGQPGPAWINAGTYLIENILETLLADHPSACSLERDGLSRLTHEGRLFGFPSRATFLDIGIPEDYRKATALLQAKVP